MTKSSAEAPRVLYLYRLNLFDDHLFPASFVQEDYLPDLSAEWRRGPEGLPDMIRLVRCQKFTSSRFSDVRIDTNDLGFELPDILSVGVQTLVNQKALEVFEVAFPDGVLSYPISILGPDGRPYVVEPYFYFVPKFNFRFTDAARPSNVETNFSPSRVDGVGTLATFRATYDYVMQYPFWTHLGLSKGFLMRPDVLQKLQAAGVTGLEPYTRQDGSGKLWESIGYIRLD